MPTTFGGEPHKKRFSLS
ncbi:hypothetical protein [Staphylococcus aureus]